MTYVGIEGMNLFGGTTCLDVMELAEYRKLDNARFANLLMKEKTIALPHEDPVTFAVNAAKPLVDALSESEKNRIELLITCSESGVDFGKSISTYVHQYLGLERNCRLFELKQACYSGTAGFQMAVNFILSQVSPGAKALVITTDLSRFIVEDGGGSLSEDWSFAEPSSGAGAVALLISEKPYIYQVDVGANGYYGYEVMDTCRPVPDGEAGNADLSLMAYLECCEKSYLEYNKRVTGVEYQTSFDYLAFHTPFGGMVKGAHRNMMRKVARVREQENIEEDFNRRVMPGITYCQRVGNIMGGTVFMSLVSTIDNSEIDAPKRIGCFSYGSGCCSEFYSGVVTPEGKESLNELAISEQLDNRYRLTIEEYTELLKGNSLVKFGTKDVVLDYGNFPDVYSNFSEKKLLFLKEISEFHREYEWRS